jgi:glutathione S-transferase
MSGIMLYDFELDDNCYKVRLLLAALGVEYAKVPVNVFPAAEQRSAKFLALNPSGELPILTDGGLVLSEAEAILAYLARRYDPAHGWLPDDPSDFGAVMTWLAFASRRLQAASLARLHSMMEVAADAVAVRKGARAAFRVMDDHMTHREFDGAHWFAAGRATIADIALFPAIALSRDAGIEHDEYPALRRWMRRMRAIPGFKTMPGIPDYH